MYERPWIGHETDECERSRLDEFLSVWCAHAHACVSAIREKHGPLNVLISSSTEGGWRRDRQKSLCDATSY